MFNGTGDPVTSDLAEGAMAVSKTVLRSEASNDQSPSPLNPLGAKGIGESGTISLASAERSTTPWSTPSAHLGVRHIDMPTTPERVWTAIGDAQKARNP